MDGRAWPRVTGVVLRQRQTNFRGEVAKNAESVPSPGCEEGSEELVTPRSISLWSNTRAPRTSKFIKTGSFNRRAHYAVAMKFHRPSAPPPLADSSRDLSREQARNRLGRKVGIFLREKGLPRNPRIRGRRGDIRQNLRSCNSFACLVTIEQGLRLICTPSFFPWRFSSNGEGRRVLFRRGFAHRREVQLRLANYSASSTDEFNRFAGNKTHAQWAQIRLRGELIVV